MFLDNFFGLRAGIDVILRHLKSVFYAYPDDNIDGLFEKLPKTVSLQYTIANLNFLISYLYNTAFIYELSYHQVKFVHMIWL